MRTAEIFRDRRAAMIGGAALLHMTALTGAWALMPPGTETRLNRPIEASFAPAPSSDVVNMNSTPLATEVQSTSTAESMATEDTAEVVPPEAATPEGALAPTQPSAKPDTVAAETSRPMPEAAVQPDTMVARAPSETVATTSRPPVAQPQQVATLAPDVLTTAAPAESVEMPTASLPVLSTQDVTASAETTTAPKPEKPKHVQATRRKAEPAKQATKPAVQGSRFARLDVTTQVRRAQKGGAGAISDIGMADSARTNGASVQAYAAMLKAAVLGRMRAMGDIGCRGGARASVAAVISPQGRIGSVRLASASGDAVLDRAALAAVRAAALPTPPNKAIPAIIPLSCPRT